MILGTIFAWIMIISVFASLAGIFGGLLSIAIDVFIPVAIFLWVIRSLTSNMNKRRNRSRKSVIQPEITVRDGFQLTEQQKVRIDRALRTYFKDHDRLVISGDVNLRPAGGQYTTLRDLDVYQKDDQVAKLSEFNGNYTKFYRKTTDLLNMFAGQASPTSVIDDVKEEVKEAPKPKKDESEFDTASEYIDKINGLNDEIQDEEISNGLYQVTAYLSQIQLIEKKFPEKHSKLKKVYHYYLPILIKILEQYRTFSQSANGTEDFKKSEEQLKKTIVLINGALKTITETICAEDLSNLNADMTTLAMLLKNDGLVEEGNQLKVGGK